MSNSTAFSEILGKSLDRFNKLYRKKVYVHHYTQYIEETAFTEGAQTMDNLRQEYSNLEEGKNTEHSGGLMEEGGGDVIRRYKPLF